MENFTLTKSELEDIGALMNISYSLLDNFIKLCDLEVKGGKDSEEFKSTIACIQSTLMLEQSFYDRFGNDRLKLQAILNEFISPENAWNLNKELEIASSQNKDELIKRRIILRIIDKMNMSKEPSIPKSLFEGLKEGLNNLMDISLSVKKDLINTILTILNLYLNDYKYQHINERLNTFKYNMAFLYKYVETDFLANNFSINPELYWSSYFAVSLRGLPKEIVVAYQREYSSELLETQLDSALNQNSYTLREKDNYAKAIISQLLIRAGLLYSADEIVDDLSKKFQNFMNVNKMMNGDNSAELLVMEAIQLYPQDKSLPKIISFGLNM